MPITRKAGELSLAGFNALIAVSFLRLFLGGLLPSRARFRFAGSQTIDSKQRCRNSVPANLSPNFRVSTTGSTPVHCHRIDPTEAPPQL